MKCPVNRCTGEQNPGWSICRPCAADLTKALAETPALAGHLATTLARQTSRGHAGGSRSAISALPYDPTASEAAWVLRSTLVAWIRDLEPDRSRQPDDELAGMGRWLLVRVPALVVHSLAEDLVGEILAATGNAWRTVDIAPDRMFLGRCGCGSDVYAFDGRLTARCVGCGAVHDTATMRDAALDALGGVLVTAAEFAAVAARLGLGERQRVRTLVNVWASRGVVVARPGPDGPSYRFGELQTRIIRR